MEILKKNNRTLRGSFTVEISIVFSIIFLLIIALVYMFIIAYQYVFIQSIANQASTIGAGVYVNQNKSQLYWRITNNKSYENVEIINSYILSRLKKSILKIQSNVDNNYTQKFLINQINIEIRNQYRLPIGDFLGIFGIPNEINIKAHSSFPLDDNAEFIRNLDTVLDIKKYIQNSDNRWFGKDSKLSAVIDKILKR